MIIENPTRLIRELKGAPISVLLAIAYAGQPVGLRWICENTGYTDKPVQSALNYLRDHGFVTKTTRYESWMIASAEQLPLTFDQLESGSRNYSDSRPATTTINFKLEESYERISSSSKSSRNNSDSRVENGKPIVSPDDPVYQLLAAAGIGEPKRSDLCECEWMTEEYVNAHIERAKADKTPIRLLIWKLQNHDPAPVIEEPEDTSYLRYIMGEFADYIEH